MKTEVKEIQVKETIEAGETVQAKTVVSEPKATTQPVTKLTSKLNTSSLSIQNILNPTIKKGTEMNEEELAEQDNTYNEEQFLRAWKEHALNLKRLKKDSLFATLMHSDKTINSDHQIHMILQNSIQETELNEEKGDLVRFLRQKLGNTKIDLMFTVTKEKKTKVMDSKASFEKLAEENSSLNKFRKLFNLDIEF